MAGRHAPWHISHSVAPGFAFLSAILYGLYILSYPPRTSLKRKLHIFILALPLWYAFRNSDYISSSFTVVDTFSRTCIIWFAHMSYEVCVLEFSPVIGDKSTDTEGGGKTGWLEDMKERVRQGYKVLFDRNHTQIFEAQSYSPSLTSATNSNLTEEPQYKVTHKKTDEPLEQGTTTYPPPLLPRAKAHGYSRTQFLRSHLIKTVTFYALRKSYEYYEHNFSLCTFSTPSMDDIALGYFFRRLPSSLNILELWYRVETVFDWNIVTIWQYEAFHSFFALLWVGSFIDSPEEWSMSLFGPISEGWSVRSYWGKHWHNYVYHSFSGHVKILTRGWLGFQRERTRTRLLENSLVFLLSGLMHSLVRWQQSPLGDFWAILLWYGAQMLPIVVESVASHYWRKVRWGLGVGKEAKWVNRMEYVVGYCWVMGWFSWTVPKYLSTRMQWSDAKLEKMFREELGVKG
jgi:hypothetical protein